MYARTDNSVVVDVSNSAEEIPLFISEDHDPQVSGNQQRLARLLPIADDRYGSTNGDSGRRIAYGAAIRLRSAKEPYRLSVLRA